MNSLFLAVLATITLSLLGGVVSSPDPPLVSIDVRHPEVGSDPSNNSYRVAVAQFVPWSSPDGNATLALQTNVLAFETVVANASSLSADVVVFPEGATGYFDGSKDRATITPYCQDVPYVFNGVPTVNPCLAPNSTNGGDDTIRALSCMAREYSIMVVVNLCEKRACSNNDTTRMHPAHHRQEEQQQHQQQDVGVACPSDNQFLFDTTVVFSNSGAILSVYEKYNLFEGDDVFNRFDAPIVTYFDAAFPPKSPLPVAETARRASDTYVSINNHGDEDNDGVQLQNRTVRFGLFICFDVLYRSPAYELTASPYNITDILYSTYWENGALNQVYQSSQVQQGYSITRNVNLVASNILTCPENCGGGVYLAGGHALVHYWEPVSDEDSDEWAVVLLVADVPIRSGSNDTSTATGDHGQSFPDATVVRDNQNDGYGDRSGGGGVVNVSPSIRSQLGNTTDCGFGPSSCSVFHPPSPGQATIMNLKAVSDGLTCFAIVSFPANSTFNASMGNRDEVWALVAQAVNSTVPKSPSTVNVTNCILHLCAGWGDDGTSCQFQRNFTSTNTVFDMVSITASSMWGASSDAYFPIVSVARAQFVQGENINFSRGAGGTGASLVVTNLTQPLYTAALIGNVSPLLNEPSL